MSERIEELILALRTRYDYILLDSVPAMAVADAIIIDRLVDLTVYVIRQGYLDRRQLPDIETLYREKKFRNMCVILNSATHSGHGYGYGYYSDNEELNFWQRLMAKITGKE